MARHPVLLVIILLFVIQFRTQAASDSTIIIRNIQIRGNIMTKDYVILREMSLKAGDTLTQTAINHDRDNIYNLGLFNKVDIDYSIQQDSASVYVTVFERWYIIPYPIVGMKYRDLSKLYYGVGFIHQNFQGQNEKINTNICFGYDQWITLNYQNPKVTSEDDIFITGVFTVQKIHNLSTSNGEYENSNIFSDGTIGKRFGMYQTLSGSLGYEIWQVSDPQLHRTISSSGHDAFLAAAIQYRYDTRNNREYTTDGTLISLSALKDGFGESDMNISSFSYDLRKFFGFNEESGFGLRTFGTFTWGGIIPPYKHVFFGYDARIRGYFYNIFEAENQVGANIELRLPILLPRYLEFDWIRIPEFQKLRYGIYFGIFADAGTLWSRNQIVREQPLYSGYGAGLQFLLPYGFTIRTEVAVNNDGKMDYILDFDTSF